MTDLFLLSAVIFHQVDDRIETRPNKSTRAIGGDEFVDMVRSAISVSLANRNLSIDRCAKLIGVSRRSMQRNLKDSGEVFTELVDRIRLETAEALLADQGLSMGEIASRLDYANAANFARAFQRLRGITPARFRQELESSQSIKRAKE